LADITFRGKSYTVPLMTLGQITRVSWIEGQIAELTKEQDVALSLEEFDARTKRTDELYTQKLVTIFGSGGPGVLRSDLQPDEQEALESFFYELAGAWVQKLRGTRGTSEVSTVPPGTQNSPTGTT
jgi:hypothetical protein